MSQQPEKRPMRHRWHYNRRGRRSGDVTCLRRGCNAIAGPFLRARSCKPKKVAHS